jgi:hypothetical protein
VTGPWLEPVEDVSDERLSHLALTCAGETVVVGRDEATAL